MEEILRILLYFDVFSYPLTADELMAYSGTSGKQREVLEVELQKLVQEGLIREQAGYYIIGKDNDAVRRRIDGNRRAEERLKTARRYSRIIASFPFVRGVFISGSISKGSAAPDDDIDYFIVTSPRRLWLTRSLLTLFKKIFLLNSHRNFCINYFVDTAHLTIQQQNRFTATELAFLLPTYNRSLHHRILQANTWIKKYYPAFTQSFKHGTDNAPAVKRWVEHLLNNGMGDLLESTLFKMSRRIIRNKHQHLKDKQFASHFSLTPHEIRYFPNRQQYRIMLAYCRRLARFGLHSRMGMVNDKSDGVSKMKLQPATFKSQSSYVSIL